MFAFGVPVPGTISAVAPNASADMNADPMARTADERNARTPITSARTDLRMCQQSHNRRAKAVQLLNVFPVSRCRIHAMSFVGQVESGTEGSAHNRKVMTCNTLRCCSAPSP